MSELTVDRVFRELLVFLRLAKSRFLSSGMGHARFFFIRKFFGSFVSSLLGGSLSPAERVK